MTGQDTPVLVLGGAGFIGSHLVDALVTRGHRVRVFDCLLPQVHGALTASSPRHLNTEAELIRGDMTDPDALRAALDGVEVIFHDAAEVGVGQSMYEITRYTRSNTLGTAVLLQLLASRREGIRKLIVASSMSIYGEGAYSCHDHGTVYPTLRDDAQLAARDWEMRCPACGLSVEPIPTDETKPLAPTSIYAINKRDQEEMCLVVGRAYHVPTVALRYFNVYGPRQSVSNPYTGIAAIFSSRLLNDKPPLIFEDGWQRRDFIHVSDIVRANLLAMESSAADYQAINVGTGHSSTVSQVASTIAAGLGKDIPAEIVGQSRAGDIRHCFADISKAERLLDFHPAIDFETGMSDLLAWVRREQATDRVDEAQRELTVRGLAV